MKKLVVCFSDGGTTLAKAEQLAKEHAADLFELKAKVPYTAADVNWQDNASRNVKEQNDKSSRPEIELLPDLSGVDELWLGYPIWWYTHPRIINTFWIRRIWARCGFTSSPPPAAPELRGASRS